MRKGQKILALVEGMWHRGFIVKILSRSTIYVACEGPPHTIHGVRYIGVMNLKRTHKRKGIKIMTKKKERKWHEYY